MHWVKPPVPVWFSALVTGADPEPQISRDAWLTRLPGLVKESLVQWDVSPDDDRKPPGLAAGLTLPGAGPIVHQPKGILPRGR